MMMVMVWISRWSKNKEWRCNPVDCEAYSSVGYILLGFALAQNAGVERWQDYDLMTIIPEHLRPKYKDIHWAKEGKCSQYDDKEFPLIQ